MHTKALFGYRTLILICLLNMAVSQGTGQEGQTDSGEYIQIPELLRQEIYGKAKSFVESVYPDADGAWVQNLCADIQQKEEYWVQGIPSNSNIVRINSGSAQLYMDIPYMERIEIESKIIPPGIILLEQGMIDVEMAQEIAEETLGRVTVPTNSLILINSGMSKRWNSYYFIWREDSSVQGAIPGRYISISVDKEEGFVRRITRIEYDEVPTITFANISEMGRMAVADFSPKKVTLERRLVHGQGRLVWAHRTENPPQIMETLWDAHTGELLHSDALLTESGEIQTYTKPGLYDRLSLEEGKARLEAAVAAEVDRIRARQ